MQAHNDDVRRLPVMVRAWGDEPVKLSLHKIENKTCYVGSKDTTKPIGLPVDQVFSWDVERFDKLCTAFQQGDKRKLGELWAKIPVDDYACNKYQNRLDSLHDQKDIADSERSAGSNS